MARKQTDFIVIHCSATKPSMNIDADTIDSWHRKRGFFSVGYHFVLKRDGTREIGRHIDEVGAHAKGFNHRSIGICLVGGVTQDDHTIPEDNFTKEQFESSKNKITDIQDRYEITHIIGHRDVDDRKECPSFDVGEWAKDNGLV